MKALLFKAVSVSTVGVIWLSDRLFAFVIWLLSWTSQLLRVAIANIGGFILKRGFPQQYAEVEGQIELESQQTELDLLASVSKLKEHALEIGEWTQQHSEAINAVGNALFNECDWDEDSVHQYMREVVESIPGLKYGVPDDPFDGLLE